MKLCNYISSLLCALFLLLSCSSGGAYPYMTIDGDPYRTRIYTLPSGTRLYLTKDDAQPRATAAILLPSVDSDSLERLYTPSVHSREYRSLLAQIGSHGTYITENRGGVALCNDIPCNEIENWAAIMRGTFSALPDSFSVVVSGNIAYDDVAAIIDRQFAGAALFPTAKMEHAANDDAHLLFALHPSATNMQRSAHDGTLSDADVMSLKENYLFALADGFHDNRFRVRMIADALLRGAACNSAALLAGKLDGIDRQSLASAQKIYPIKALQPDVRSDAMNSISLSPPMPVEIAFPDIAELNEKQTYSENMVKGISRVLLCVDYSGLPATFPALVARYLKESFLGSVVHIEAAPLEKSLLLEFHATAENIGRVAEEAISRLADAADGEKFYGYLSKNSAMLSDGKLSVANIAAQAAGYTKGGKRITGLRALASASMQRIFSASSSLLAFGDKAESLLSSFKHHFKAAVSEGASSTAFADEALPGRMLVAMQCDTVYTIEAAPVGGADEHIMMQLFNMASELACADSLCRYTTDGVCCAMGGAVVSQLPFDEKCFDAARSLLMYDLSTYGDTPQSAVCEYLMQRRCGYSSSELYDAVCGISYSDVKDFHRWHSKASQAQIVAGKGSSATLRSLATEEGTVYITLDELFGY